jgi:hypothetical protein
MAQLEWSLATCPLDNDALALASAGGSFDRFTDKQRQLMPTQAKPGQQRATRTFDQPPARPFALNIDGDKPPKPRRFAIGTH